MSVTSIQLASALIQVFEGLKLTAYRDSGGILTIGFGHTGPDVVEGMKITLERAQELLIKDQSLIIKLIEKRNLPLIESAALISFGYNCGTGALLRVLDGHFFLTDWIKDHKGNTLPGLVARRNLEETLINLSDDLKKDQVK